jgi:imidazolonepropionase-like amidohydrolase
VWGPAGGYPSNLEPSFGALTDRASIGAAFDESTEAGAIGIKLTFERGFSRQDDWPLFDAAQRTALREESAARGVPLFVHAMTPSEFLLALELAPRAFVHAPEEPDAPITWAIAASGAYVVTTMSVFDAALWARDERTLADPLLTLVVPDPVLDAARDRDTAVRARQALGELVLPSAPRWATGMGSAARWVARSRVKSAIRAVRELHEAGVPLVLGTDSGTWPVFHTQFPGWAALHELELLARAGLSPMEVLRAGTAVPSALLGLERELGTLEVGKAADLVVLAADPLRDPAAYRSIVWTARGGEVRTPAEWIAR